MEKTLILCIIMGIAVICSCRPSNEYNSAKEFEEKDKDMFYKIYSVHHLLAKDPNGFLSFYYSKMPESVEDYRKFIIERTNTKKFGGKRAVEDVVRTQKQINVNIVRGALSSKKYNVLKEQVKILLQRYQISEFVALEEFFHKSGIEPYGYKCMILFDTPKGSLVLENVVDNNDLHLHKSNRNVRAIMNVLLKKKWYCTLKPFYITEFGFGNVVSLTSFFQGNCYLSNISNLPVWQMDKMPKNDIGIAIAEYQLYLDAFSLISQSSMSRSTESQSDG